MTSALDPHKAKEEQGADRATLRVVEGVAKISAAQWDACAGADNPTLSHAFLLALEESGSASPETGWWPHHLVLEGPDGTLLGAVVMYLKAHSFGEYVFDHGWADAYERVGGRYYPKLQAAVPFTPVTGRRLLVRPGADSPWIEDALIGGCREAAERLGVSSLHVTFPTEGEWRRLRSAGYLCQTGVQFHWENRGYGDFEAFLKALSARKRKTIRKERRAAQSHPGVAFETLTGDAIRERHWDAFFRFYRLTTSRKWGEPYLTRSFFRRLGETMADKVVLVMAAREGRYVAGALNLLGSDTLYGRNWGCIEELKFLHFEACYYRAIDFAIERGLARVEAGAQGPHKLSRGYLPKPTYSAHLIRDPRLRAAVSRHLARERRTVDAEIEALAAESPFRKDTG